jgi:hypothetical protein
MNDDPLNLPLRDIHLPEAVSLWPLAYGWWILAGLILAAALAAWLVYLRRQHMKLSATRLAREELLRLVDRYHDEKNPVTLSRQLSILLRRVSISLFPRVDVASLTGDAWLKFLDGQVDDAPFSRGEGRILTEAPYRSRVTNHEVDQLLRHCRDWIDAVAVSEAGRK